MIVGTLAEIGHTIVTDAGGHDVVVNWTGQPLNSDSFMAARGFLCSLDVEHGDRVVVLTSSTIDCVAVMVAAWALGLVVVPVKGGLRDAGVLAVADDCEARFVIDPVAAAALPCRDGPRALGRFRFLSARQVSGSDLALIIYTSGSSGRPKGIMLTHANVVAATHAIVAALGLGATDRILCVSPLSFDYGLYQILFAFHTGCTTVLFDRAFNPLACLEAVRVHGITVLPVVPSMGIAIARTAKALRSQLPGLRLVTNTGGHLPDTTVAMLREALPSVAVAPMYGLSESKRALIMDPADVGHRPGSVGRPMPGLAAAVFTRTTDADGVAVFEEAPPGVPGELFVRGPSVMQGYCQGPGGGAEIIPGAYRDDNWLATGDLFVCDEDGFFFYRGRAKELIKQDGYCLYPRDIEQVAEEHGDVEAAVVFGMTDDWGNEVACLAVQLTEGASGAGAEASVRSWIEQHLSGEYRPRLIRTVQSMPLSANGKPDRRALQAEQAPQAAKAVLRAAGSAGR